MTEEDDRAPSPKELKMQPEEEPTELLLKDEDHSLDESKEIENEDEDDDRLSPGLRHSPPPLLDMTDFPPSSTLPPTPPLPSSPGDLDMGQKDSDEDDGPPPGYQLKEQVTKQLETVAAASTISSDIHTEDAQQHATSEEGEPRSAVHPCPPPEVAPSVEDQDSEDEGPPPGWVLKCQPEHELEKTPPPDMKAEDVIQAAPNEEGQPIPEVPSDIIEDREDSDDEGPPPGYDPTCQPEPELQKPPQPDIKTNYVQDSQNENVPESQSQSHSSPAPDLVTPEQHVEGNGPPSGWISSNIQTAGPATPPSETIGELQNERKEQKRRGIDPDAKIEEDKEDASHNEGSPPGWGPTPQPQPQTQPHVHSIPPSPIIQSETGYEILKDSPQPPSRQQQPVQPPKQQIIVPKPPTTMNNPVMMGQMVCGSCRHLLSYPRGARYVECACCLEENYVLEEHEVGQVVCEGCDVLLMYPYGAPKVRCANCRSETEIGDENRRPTLSEHKRQARQHLKRFQAGDQSTAQIKRTRA